MAVMVHVRIVHVDVSSVHARLRQRETVREKKRSYSRAKTAQKKGFVFVSVSVQGKGGPNERIAGCISAGLYKRDIAIFLDIGLSYRTFQAYLGTYFGYLYFLS